MNNRSAATRAPQIRPSRNAPIAKSPPADNERQRLFFKDDTYGHNNPIEIIKPPENQKLPSGLCFREAKADATVYSQSNPPG